MRTPLTIRPIDQWPDRWLTPKERKPNPFRGGYDSTLVVLDHELDRLEARSAHLQVDVEHADLRRDGMLRAHAKVGHPGVILTIDTARLGVLTYPCDTFAGRWTHDPPDWQINLRAIALGLEALRKVERYGIAERGEQYAGFSALPPATPMGAAMTVEDAWVFLREHAGSDGADSRSWQDLYRLAAKRLHPDHGGDPALFRRLTAARDLLVEQAR